MLSLFAAVVVSERGVRLRPLRVPCSETAICDSNSKPSLAMPSRATCMCDTRRIGLVKDWESRVFGRTMLVYACSKFKPGLVVHGRFIEDPRRVEQLFALCAGSRDQPDAPVANRTA